MTRDFWLFVANKVNNHVQIYKKKVDYIVSFDFFP